MSHATLNHQAPRMIRRLDAIASGGATTVTATVEAYSGATATGRLAARPVCAAAMIAADMIAFGASALAAWLISTSGVLAPMTGGAFPAASPEALRSALAPAFILGGLLAYFLAKGHYSRRLPFWWELQQVLIGSIFALLCSSFVEFTFKTDVSRVVVFCIWVLFPLALVAMRHTARHLLSEANLWQIRTVIVGHGAAADRAAAAEALIPAPPALLVDYTAKLDATRALVGSDAARAAAVVRGLIRA